MYDDERGARRKGFERLRVSEMPSRSAVKGYRRGVSICISRLSTHENIE